MTFIVVKIRRTALLIEHWICSGRLLDTLILYRRGWSIEKSTCVCKVTEKMVEPEYSSGKRGRRAQSLCSAWPHALFWEDTFWVFFGGVGAQALLEGVIDARTKDCSGFV